MNSSYGNGWILHHAENRNTKKSIMALGLVLITMFSSLNFIFAKMALLLRG